ncbi:hypothetical protein Tco_0253779 [Tanacetum coccineum]
MTNRIDILEDVISSINEEPVTIPNGEVVPVEGRVNHTLSNETKVKGILHIPNFNCNLLSVSKLSSDLRCVMQEWPISEGMLGMKRKALMSKVDIWHKRLGMLVERS